FGTAHDATPARAPVHFTAALNLRSVPWCSIVTLSGSDAGGTSAKPAPVCLRTNTFIPTVSPARSSERSNTACVTYGPPYLPVGKLNRHGAMPESQFENANVKSPPSR